MNVLNSMTTGRAAIIGLVLAAFYYFAMFDSGVTFEASIEQQTGQLNELKSAMAENQRKLERAIVFKKTAAEVGTTINKLLGMIPEKFGMADLMRIVSNESKVAGLSLSGLNPGKSEVSKQAPEFEEISLAIDASGTFTQHMVFLSNLTKINQILILRKFDLASSSADSAKADEGTVVRLAAEIVAFRYRGTDKKAKETKETPQ